MYPNIYENNAVKNPKIWFNLRKVIENLFYLGKL
jgi:hypothetical protein